jgi:dUTP pyrophosphatase
MTTLTLKVKRTSDVSQLPRTARPGDAGLDLFSIETVPLEPGRSRLVRTGIAIELPAGTEAQIRPRSGLALEHQVTVLNAPGTIDQGYRGEIGVILINHGTKTFEVVAGMRIAQLVVQPVSQVTVIEVAEIATTERGSGGFGSTGA